MPGPVQYPEVELAMISRFYMADADYGTRLAKALGVDPAIPGRARRRRGPAFAIDPTGQSKEEPAMIRTFAAIVLGGLMTTAALALDDLPKPKPAPIVLDDATRAKLREIAFQAAREGDVKTLAAYFEAKLPPGIANDRGDTLLILAAYHGHNEAVRTILEAPKPPIDARNKMGFTAMTGAAFKGYVGIVEQLAAKGAELDASNDRGQTPLMFASMFGRTEVVRFLLKSEKVDVTRRDEKGRTARMLAEGQGKGNDKVIALLREAEAKRAP